MLKELLKVLIVIVCCAVIMMAVGNFVAQYQGLTLFLN